MATSLPSPYNKLNTGLVWLMPLLCTLASEKVDAEDEVESSSDIGGGGPCVTCCRTVHEDATGSVPRDIYNGTMHEDAGVRIQAQRCH